jgi:hypothetical protein
MQRRVKTAFLIKKESYKRVYEMAIPIRKSTTRATGYVTATSRYAQSDVLVYGEDGILTFEIYKRPNIIVTQNDQITIIPAGEEYRPDLTSFRAYGTVDLWWKIMQFNGFTDVYQYKTNLTIRIPAQFNF